MEMGLPDWGNTTNKHDAYQIANEGKKYITLLLETADVTVSPGTTLLKQFQYFKHILGKCTRSTNNKSLLASGNVCHATPYKRSSTFRRSFATQKYFFMAVPL